MDCLFCKIIAGQIPSTKVYEDEYCYAFRDIAPQAKCHVVLVSKEHVANVADAASLSDTALAAMLRAVGKIAAQENLQEGFRIVSNCGKNGCQSVDFPSISTGVYAYPLPQAARIALETIRDFLSQNDTLKQVRMVCHTEAAAEVYRQALKELREACV